MRQVSYQEKVYDVPENVWEMDLGAFIDMMILLKKEDDPASLTHQMGLLSIVSGIPLSMVEEMDLNSFTRLCEVATFAEEFKLPEVVTPDEIGLKASKEPITFEVEGETFSFQPDYAYTKLKYASKVEDILKDRDLFENLHYLLAICAIKEGEIFDLNALDKKAELMCKAKMKDVYKPLFFFALQGNTSTLFTRLSSRMASQKGPRSTVS